jgi:hypothetical protein
MSIRTGVFAVGNWRTREKPVAFGNVCKSYLLPSYNPWFGVGCSLGSYLRLYSIPELEMYLIMS